MSCPAEFELAGLASTELSAVSGRLAVIAAEDGRLDASAKALPKAAKAQVQRAVASEAWGKLEIGAALWIGYPAGLAAEALAVVKLPRKASALQARRAGGALVSASGASDLTLVAPAGPALAELVLGARLRSYAFTERKSAKGEGLGKVTVLVADPAAATSAIQRAEALARGVHWTRDLVNEPANVLTTTEFASRLLELQQLGVEMEVLDEPDLEKLGMRALLAVGQGSESPSKVVIMRWNGAEAASAPLALIGKGVCFDTGGVSLKPSAGMGAMTMDMGGAGTVAGVMKALALRKAKANVVALVGLVENMPDGKAQRPGDIVTSMKGDTIEVISTDAEGRMVLADVMWYAQQRFSPVGMIDLATLTGAIIVALGEEQAGVFSNDDAFAGAFLKAAEAEDEGAWRMPISKAHERQIKSTFADILNSTGRDAGACTAAAFLKRFVTEGMPWIHLDIAGVAVTKKSGDLGPKGATGWGVLALNRLIETSFEA